jgi:hypothetical protein
VGGNSALAPFTDNASAASAPLTKLNVEMRVMISPCAGREPARPALMIALITRPFSVNVAMPISQAH